VTSAFDPETVLVGILGRPHGVRGEITLRLYNAGSDAVDDAASLILERDGVRASRAVEGVRPAAQGLIVKLEGIDDRDAAAALTNSVVRLPRAALPPPGPGEFYVEDVIGCAVVEAGGAALGEAVGTFWNGAHDVMTVVERATGRERLIPLVPDFVLAVDVPGRRIEVRWEDDD
jgi:16S rRNA processing protein RimM